MWRPTMFLIEYINIIISVIDDFNLNKLCGDAAMECAQKYDQYYEKALRCTFDYARPRF